MEIVKLQVRKIHNHTKNMIKNNGLTVAEVGGVALTREMNGGNGASWPRAAHSAATSQVINVMRN